MKDKINIKIWIIIVLEIMIIGMFALNKQKDNATGILENEIEETKKVETSKTEVEKELGQEEIIKNIKINENLNNKNPLNTMLNLGENVGYLITYPETKPVEEEKVVLDRYASDQLLVPLLTGFPKVSYKDLGLQNEEEAYQATQLAIWEISDRTGESTHSSEKTRISGLREQWQNDRGINPKIFDVAEDMVKKAETDAYTKVPTLTVFTKNVEFNKDEDYYYFVGPYYYTIEDMSYFEVSIEIKDENGNKIKNAEVVDKYGNTITKPIDINEFYIKVPIGEDRVSISVGVKGDRLVGIISEGENNEYLFLSAVRNEMVQDVVLNIY